MQDPIVHKSPLLRPLGVLLFLSFEILIGSVKALIDSEVLSLLPNSSDRLLPNSGFDPNDLILEFDLTPWVSDFVLSVSNKRISLWSLYDLPP